MRIETDRLIITEFTMDMAQAVHENSLDEDNRRFVPDEVFETLEEARETIEFLISVYGTNDGPQVHPVITKKDGKNIGYVQMVPMEDGTWEIGYRQSVYRKRIRNGSSEGFPSGNGRTGRNQRGIRDLPEGEYCLRACAEEMRI